MKRIATVAIALVLVSLVATPSFAQKMTWGVGADVLIPTGNFGDAYSIGFGGTGEFQYDFTPMLAGGVRAGYYTWSAKSVAAGFTAPSFSGVPVRVYGKYYFMPEAAKARVYGMLELGLFFWSSKVTLPSYSIGGFTFGGGTSSTTGSDFNLVPEVGVQFPLGSVNLDVAAQYDMVMTSGNTTSDIGFRVGVVFPIGH